MRVNPSAMYGFSVYKSQSQPAKTPQFTPTTNIIDSDKIKVIRNKELTSSESQVIGKEQATQIVTKTAHETRRVQEIKAMDNAFHKVYDDIFSPIANGTKSMLSQQMDVEDFYSKVLKIVHYREAFVENMQTLLQKGESTQRHTERSKQEFMREAIYA